MIKEAQTLLKRGGRTCVEARRTLKAFSRSEVLRIQATLNRFGSGSDLGPFGCDGVMGAHTIHALDSTLCVEESRGKGSAHNCPGDLTVRGAPETTYSVSSTTLEQLTSNVPAGDEGRTLAYVAALKKLIGTNFPSPHALHSAVCDGLVAYLLKVRNAPKDMKSSDLLHNAGFDPEITPELLHHFRACAEEGDDSLIDEAFLSTTMISPPPLKPLEFESVDCGCAAPRGPGVTLYGVYPYWRDDQPTAFNYAYYHRVEYFAGVLRIRSDQPLRLFPTTTSLENAHRFVARANRYQTSVDLLIRVWDEEIDQISDLDWSDVPNKVRDAAERFSGVTFWLPAPAYNRSVGELYAQIEKLLRDVRAALPEDKRLNLMLTGSIHDADWVIDRLQPLVIRHRLDLESAEEQEGTTIDDVLVFLAEPTNDTKTGLRQLMERRFGGESRRTVIRKLIPLTTLEPNVPFELEPLDFPNNPTLDQRYADLTYYQDNFGGTGTWGLLPFVGKPHDETPVGGTEMLLDDVFPLDRPGYCAPICRERGVLLMFLLLPLSVLAAMGFTAHAVSCRVRQRIERMAHPGWIKIGALSALLGLVTAWALYLYCTEGWSAYGKWAVLAAAAVLSFLSLYWRELTVSRSEP